MSDDAFEAAAGSGGRLRGLHRGAARRSATSPTASRGPTACDRYLRISGEPVFDADGNFQGYRGVGRDVTQATLAEQKVHELARYDSLTGLPNRNMFLGELDRTLARARRAGRAVRACASSTSTASRPSTTRSATVPATSC